MIQFSRARRLWAAEALILLCSLSLPAMAATALTGTLSDPQGQVIPAATVRLLRRADSTRRETKTDAQGGFSFSGLDGGEYRLTAELQGFAVLTRTVVVRTDEEQTENLQFPKLASQNESVNVTAAVSDVGFSSQTRRNG